MTGKIRSRKRRTGQQHTMLITKLENIADDVKEIKRDYRETREEVKKLYERIATVEESAKSCHKRLDRLISTDQ